MNQIFSSKNFSIFLLLFSMAFATKAQQTAIDQNPAPWLTEGLELYEKGLYTAAMHALENFVQASPQHEQAIQARCYMAIAAIKLHHANGQAKLEEFIEQYGTSPYATSAHAALGSHYFEQQQYKEAIKHLDVAHVPAVQSLSDVENTYRLAYSYYITKQYAKARPLFAKVKTGLHQYAASASYYSGYLAYSAGDYDLALEDFERAGRDAAYTKETDVLIPSIYYKRKEYSKVAAFIKKFEESNKPMPEGLQLLAGEIYYKINDYERAYKYLLAFMKDSKGYSDRNAFYRLGYASLKVNDKDNAIRYLGKAADGNDALAQVAAYHLGLTYISANKKDFADIAFDKARKLNFDAELQELSAFYYVKVNFDNGNYSNVVTGAQFYQEKFPDGKNKDAVYELQSDALVNTGNYAKALEVLTAIKNKSMKVKSNIQLIAHNKGGQEYNDGKFPEAVASLELSNLYPNDKELASITDLWLGEIYSLGNKFERAEVYYKKVLPQYLAYNDALYGLGYCYYNMKDYAKAQSQFKAYLERPGNKNIPQKTDVIIRLADCHYVQKDYNSAISLYNAAEKVGTTMMDYVLYQRAMAEIGIGGLNAAMKNLNRVVSEYPNSKELDRVYYAMGDLMFDNARMEDAAKWFTAFIDKFKIHPQLPDVYVKRAQTYQLLGQYAQSLSDCRWVIDNHAANPIAETAIRTMIEIDKAGYAVADGREYQRKFMQANPQSSVAVEAAFGMAVKPFNDEQYELATQTLSSFARQYPQSTFAGEALYKLGLSYEFLNNADGAISSYKEVTGTYQPKALKNAGDLELNNGKAADAVTTFLLLKRVSTSERYDEFATIGLMEAYLGINDAVASLRYSDQIITQKLTRYVNMAYLYKGKAHHQQKDYTQALQYYRMTTQMSNGKEGAEAQYSIGLMLREQKQYEQSTNELIKVRNNYESYTSWIYKAFLLVADNYIAIDNTFQAKATLQSIIDNSTDPEVVAKAQQKLASL